MNKIFIYRKSNEGKLDDSKKLDTFLPFNDHLDNACKLLKNFFSGIPDFVISKALEDAFSKAMYNPITLKCHRCSQYEEDLFVSKLFENGDFPTIYLKGSIVGFFPCRTVYETSKYKLNAITASIHYLDEFVDNSKCITINDYFDKINEFTANKILAMDLYSIEHIENYEFMMIPVFSCFKEPVNTNYVKIYYDKDNYPKFAMIADSSIVSILNYLSPYSHWFKNLEYEMLNKLDVTQKLGLLYVDNLNSELNQEDNEMNEGVLIQSKFLYSRAKLSNSKMELKFLEIPKILDISQITEIENKNDDKIKRFSETIDDNEPFTFILPIIAKSEFLTSSDLSVIHIKEKDGLIKLMYAIENGLSVDELKILDCCTICSSSCNHITPNGTGSDLKNVEVPKNITEKHIRSCGQLMEESKSSDYNKNGKGDVKLTKLESRRWLIGLVNNFVNCTEFKESSFDIISDTFPFDKETAIKRFVKRHFDEKCFDDVCTPPDLEVKSPFENNDERGLCIVIPQKTFIDNLLNKDIAKPSFNVVAIPIYNTDEGDFIESKDKDFLIVKSDYEFYAFETRGMKDKIHMATSSYNNPQFLIDISVSNQILNEIFKTAPVNIDFNTLQYINAFNSSELVFDNTKGGDYVTWDLILACLSNQIV